MLRQKAPWTLGLCLALIAGLAGSGCNNLAKAAGDPKKVRVGIVFDSGGKDDRSFNAAAFRGVTRAAKDFPIVLRDAEPGDPASLEPAMRAFAEVGYDLIIGSSGGARLCNFERHSEFAVSWQSFAAHLRVYLFGGVCR